MKKHKNLSTKISCIALWISIIFLIIGIIPLWIFIGKTKMMVSISVLVGILIVMNISTLIQNKISKKKVIESAPLMKHRMNRYLTISLFLLGIGVAIFIDTWNKGFLDNLPELIIAVFFIIIGEFTHLEYNKRNLLVEKRLIRKNKKNKLKIKK